MAHSMFQSTVKPDKWYTSAIDTLVSIFLSIIFSIKIEVYRLANSAFLLFDYLLPKILFEFVEYY